MMGPWRDPISGRWIVEKPPVAVAPERVLENSEQALIDQVRIANIWRALQSSAEASQITSAGEA